ncbi:hypothetical protein MYX76_17175, partial [Desulfobacterota bacterium AH_259_B03_O07]|nr:hypothetical protein [Desulfobacterota bacterium AH_259_B03_O07]
MTSPYNTSIVYVRETPIELFGKGVKNNRKDGYHSSRVQLKLGLTKGEQYIKLLLFPNPIPQRAQFRSCFSFFSVHFPYGGLLTIFS